MLKSTNCNGLYKLLEDFFKGTYKPNERAILKLENQPQIRRFSLCVLIWADSV